jgi:hypothetical protein
MPDPRLPTEVELVYEVMPCNAMRTAQEPIQAPHPCSYFRKWGTYHSYDYLEDGPPPTPGIVHDSLYVGRAPLVPEVLSGCRKAPLLALGINPNLPGWWPRSRGSLNPLFDDYKQYAHYFRYRAVAKLEVPPGDYAAFGGSPADTPFSRFELNVPRDSQGRRLIPTRMQPQKMYQAYQGFLDELAAQKGWGNHRLALGEDLAYGNMVACPSAKWVIGSSSGDPDLPGMTREECLGIVEECFHARKYFLRQLFQTLPGIILIFSHSTAAAFIAELQDRFVTGSPTPQDSLEELGRRTIRLEYGILGDGTALQARVIFSPHITGSPEQFAAAKQEVLRQLREETDAGALAYNPQTGHLRRGRGGCVFCTMLGIGPCDYTDELQPLATVPRLTAESPISLLMTEKAAQAELYVSQPVKGGAAETWMLDDADRSPT